MNTKNKKIAVIAGLIFIFALSAAAVFYGNPQLQQGFLGKRSVKQTAMIKTEKIERKKSSSKERGSAIKQGPPKAKTAIGTSTPQAQLEIASSVPQPIASAETLMQNFCQNGLNIHNGSSTAEHQEIISLLKQILEAVQNFRPVVYQQPAMCPVSTVPAQAQENPAPAALPAPAPQASSQENAQPAQEQTLSEVLANPLVLHYDFEEIVRGRIMDKSSAGNIGLPPKISTEESGGGNAFVFDGASDFIEIGRGKFLDITKQITVAAWVKFTDISEDFRYIYKRSGNYGLGLYSAKNSGQIAFGFFDMAGNYLNVFSQEEFNDGTLHHVAGTHDGSILKLYIDGVLADFLATQAEVYYQTPFSAVGKNGDENNRYWQGSIDDFRIYAKALNEEEIQKIISGEI